MNKPIASFQAASGQEELLIATLQSLAVPCFAVDSNGRQIIANKAMTELTGFSLAELQCTVARPAHWSDEDLPQINALFKDAAEGKAGRHEVIFKRKDGRRLNVMVTLSPLCGGASIRCCLATVEDMTRLRENQAELRREHLQAIELARGFKSLRRVSDAVSGSLDLAALSELVVDAMSEALALDGAVIRYLEDATQELVLLAYRGVSEDLSRELGDTPRLKMGQSLAGKVALSGEIMVLPDLPEDATELFPSTSKSNYHAYIGLPLKVKGKVVGVVVGFSLQRRSFSSEEMEMLSGFGNLVGMAINNALLFKKVEAGHTQWESTFDAMSDGAAIVGMDGFIQRANWALARMLRTTPWLLAGKSCDHLIGGCEDSPGQCMGRRSAAIRDPCSRVRREPDMNNAMIQLRVDPLMDSSGGVAGMVHVFRDVTREQEQQASLEKLFRLSHVLSRSLDLEKVAAGALEEFCSAFCTEQCTCGIAMFEDFDQVVHIIEAKGLRAGSTRGKLLPVTLIDGAGQRLLLNEHVAWCMEGTFDRSELAASLCLQEYRSLVALPLVVGDRTAGFILWASREEAGPAVEKRALLEAYAREIAMAVANSQLYMLTDASLRRRVGELEGLTGILSAAASGLDLRTILDEVLVKSARSLGVERAGIALFDSVGGVSMAIDFDDTVARTKDEGREGFIEKLASAVGNSEGLKTVVVNNTNAKPENQEAVIGRNLGLRSYILVPLVNRGGRSGVIGFASATSPRIFSRGDISLTQAISGHLSSVIDNVRLHERTEEERGTLESILASLGEGLIVVGAERKVSYCNPAAENLLGVRNSYFAGQPLEVLYRQLYRGVIEPPYWKDSVSNGLETGMAGVLTLSVQFAERKYVECTLFPIRREGRLLGAGMVLRDVTKEREVDRMKTEFVSVASHELRTPLTSIFGYAELLLARSVSLKVKERKWVETMYRESKRLGDIVGDLLNVSRIESGRLSLRLGAVNLRVLVSGLIEQMQLGTTTHRMVNLVSDSVPPVRADKDKLKQVLYNLADNAIKYSPNGGDIVFAADVKESGVVVLTVTDNGMGIPQEEMPRIFEKFHRILRVETAGLRGSGLGLYIVRSLVQMMKGEIEVSSQVGRGTTFAISMPLFCEEEDDAKRPDTIDELV